MKKTLIAPSILAGDFGKLAREAKRAERAGADWLHVDVMDGHFVPNVTFGPKVVAALRQAVKLPLDVHLMIKHPQNYIEQFAGAGSDYLTIHVEADTNIGKTLNRIRELGVRPGIVLNPDTPASRVRPYLERIELILVMSVWPGFGNQRFIPAVLPKLKKIRQYIKDSGRKIDLEIDGGINPQTAKLAVQAGANVLVAGSAIYGKKNIGKAIKVIKNSILK